MRAIQQLPEEVSISAACEALGVARSTYYRLSKPESASAPLPPPKAVAQRSPRRLPDELRDLVLAVLHLPCFVDKAPAEVYAILLDLEIYLCSERTMYRILAEHGEVRERRDQLRHPPRSVPRLVATRPNEVWSWDITKLRGPRSRELYYLYVVLDLFSRYVVGWMLAGAEKAALAHRLLRESVERERVVQESLTIHADRGPSMTSKPVAQLLADLGVDRSHSRPRCSNDNPFSESQFKTLKNQPSFPGRFAAFEEAQAFCRGFFDWYNHEHRHSGIALLTPADVHYGRADQVIAERQQVLTAVYEEHPERFVNGPPSHPTLPAEVWINPPLLMEADDEKPQ